MKWKGAPVDAEAERTPLRRLSAEEMERIWDEAVAHADLTLTDEQRKVRAYLLGQARTQW